MQYTSLISILEYYNMEDVSVRGYYAKITKLVGTTPPPGMEVEVADDN